MKQTISTRAIAKELGISPMTVSRVINGSSNVKAETRDSILKYLEKNGQHLHRAALTGKRQFHVIIESGTLQKPELKAFTFFSTIYFAIINDLKRYGISFELTDLSRKPEENISAILSADAAILIGHDSENAISQIRAYKSEIPILTICFNTEDTPAISPDDIQGGALAAALFHSKGHLHSAVFANIDDKSFMKRYESFRNESLRLNSDAIVDLIKFNESDSIENSDHLKLNALENYFRSRVILPSAIFCPNGYAAMLLYKFLKSKNIRIPEDVSVLGYDNFDYYDFLDPAMSRIIFDIESVGNAAAAKVKDMLENENRSPEGIFLIPCKVIERDSIKKVN